MKTTKYIQPKKKCINCKYLHNCGYVTELRKKGENKRIIEQVHNCPDYRREDE